MTAHRVSDADLSATALTTVVMSIAAIIVMVGALFISPKITSAYFQNTTLRTDDAASTFICESQSRLMEQDECRFKQSF
jgi:hypothetical protein